MRKDLHSTLEDDGVVVLGLGHVATLLRTQKKHRRQTIHI